QKQVADKQSPVYDDWLSFQGRKPDKWEVRTAEDRQVNPEVIEKRYTAMIWFFFEPTAEELYDHDTVLVDRTLSQLSLALIKARPVLYAKWVSTAYMNGLRNLLRGDFAKALLSLVGLSYVAYVFRCRWKNPLKLQLISVQKMDDYFIAFNVMLCIG